MKTITLTLYEFDELDAKAQARAIDWWRESSHDDNSWADWTIEDFIANVAAPFGWQVTRNKVYWSGFWCQGDGASFEGDWSPDCMDAARLQRGWPKDAVLQTLMQRLIVIKDTLGSYISVTHAGHYCHEFATYFSSDEELPQNVEEEFKSITRALMRWLYNALEQEYNYQNSDKTIAENIRINGYYFRADGSYERVG